MTNRILFYIAVLLFVALQVEVRYGVHDPVQLAELTLVFSGMAVGVITMMVLTAAWFTALRFVKDFSEPGRIAFAVVDGLVNTDEAGRPRLPDAHGIGGKRSFRLAQLYETPQFRKLLFVVQLIGPPCRLLFKLVSRGA